MTDGNLGQDTTQMKLDVLSAMHFIAEAWRLITPNTNKNCFVRVVSQLVMSAALMTVQRNSLKMKMTTGTLSLGVQFEDYKTCDSVLEVWGIHIVDQVLDQLLTRPEEETKEEE
jgi:hypothetical protein